MSMVGELEEKISSRVEDLLKLCRDKKIGLVTAESCTAGLLSYYLSEGEGASACLEGALARSPANLAISITGVAGPTPDEDGNHVGLVHLAVARTDKTLHVRKDYGNLGRQYVLGNAVLDAIELSRAAANAWARHPSER